MLTIDALPKYCITLPEKPERTEAAIKHFSEGGLENVTMVSGIHGEGFGLDTKFLYEVDNPGSGFKIGPSVVGIWLSHWMLWLAATLMEHEHVMILEDDAQLLSNWKKRTAQALEDVPPDFDWLFIGSCCAGSAKKTLVKGEVWDARYPVCFQAYIISKAGARKLVETQRKCYAPIDVSAVFHSFKAMRVFTLFPMAINQFNTEIPP